MARFRATLRPAATRSRDAGMHTRRRAAPGASLIDPPRAPTLGRVSCEPRYRWASDHGLLVTFGDEPTDEVREAVLSAAAGLEAARLAGLRNLHPAYASVLAICDPLAVTPQSFERAVREAVGSAPRRGRSAGRLVEVPVSYDAESGPDLEEVAHLHGL